MASTPQIAAVIFSLLAMTARASDGAAACDVRSGARLAALVELYTSEGCSSCPPADRQLGELTRILAPDALVVPLALHVDYWDSIGWKDPYAQAKFSDRHDRRVRENHHTIVYTPHFFVSGQELRSGGTALREAVAGTNARLAQARLTVHAQSIGDDAIAVAVDARAEPGTAPASLYLALAQNGLISNVTRGENSGARLQHDHVVREWVGPLALANGAAHVERRLAVPAGSRGGNLEVVAFVEDAESGSVLQAVRAQPCGAPPPAPSAHALAPRPIVVQAPGRATAASGQIAGAVAGAMR